MQKSNRPISRKGIEMKNAEDTQLLAKLMVKYAPMSPSKAIKELLEIDFIKNNFSKNTIYNYLQGTRSLIKTGYPTRCIPKDLVQVIEKIKKQDKEEQPKYLERIANAVERKIKNRVKTTEELIQELDEKYKEIKTKASEVRIKIANEIDNLNEKLGIVNKVAIEEERKIVIKIEELKEKQARKMLGIESEGVNV
jgi:hypothetical protein